jgi:hypothetical protein
MHLGELAAAKAETTQEQITFDWHGRRIRCRAVLPSLPLLELAATGDELKGTLDEDNFMIVGGAFYRFLESVIDVEDWPTFRKISTEHSDGPEELLPLIEKIGAAISGRPTERRSGSRAGPSATTDSSTAPLPSRASMPDLSALAG